MERLIDQEISFYVSQWQLYLPFMGAVFVEEKQAERKVISDQFTVSEQCVFLAILMAQETECIVALLRQQLAISQASVSRALASLHTRRLLSVQGKFIKKCAY